MLLCFVLGLLIQSAWTNEDSRYTSYNEDIDIYYPSETWSDTFDWKLLKVLSEKSQNVLTSPISLKLVLSILYEGAGGATEREFQSGLKFSKKQILREKFRAIIDSLQTDQESKNKLSLNTRLFLDTEFTPKEKFTAIANAYYDAAIQAMNFSDPIKASDNINTWIEQATLGKIPELVNPDDLKETILLISNAVYFKGTWIHQFPKNQTCISKFYINPTNMVFIPFMSTTDYFYFFDSQYLDAKILRLPYKGNEYSMFIILPHSKGGLPQLIQKINLYDLHRQLYFLDRKTVQVSIPKFSFSFKTSYSKILQQFGLHSLFQNTASFPGIVKGHSSLLRRLVVSEIIQSAGLEIDEEGSIAYSATEVVIGNKIGVPEDVFNVTHPFLFFIGEEINGTIVFIGKVENPLQSEAIVLPTTIAEDFEAETPTTPVPKNVTKYI